MKRFTGLQNILDSYLNEERGNFSGSGSRLVFSKTDLHEGIFSGLGSRLVLLESDLRKEFFRIRFVFVSFRSDSRKKLFF